jgi:hypothetical protein
MPKLPTIPSVPMNYFKKIFLFFFSAKSKLLFEKTIFVSAILTFIVHFLLITLSNWGKIPPEIAGDASWQSPINAIYTPFTIILIFEIYLLVYYLPSSITSYLGRQYEVIALIFIRQIFSDLSVLSEENAIVEFENLKMLSLSFAGLLVLFLLIFCFYKLSGRKEIRFDEFHVTSSAERRFIISKKIMAFFLMLFFIYLFISSLFDASKLDFSVSNIPYIIKTINDTFFQQLFVALILSEVLLLLFTFNLTDKFHKILRNAGFIISTTLLKISFVTQGVSNMIVVLIAVAFGVAVLGIYRLYDKKIIE